MLFNRCAEEGTFAVGYKTKFETVGTNVNITFEPLDQKMVWLFSQRESPLKKLR
jgi:hypothetical protein